MFGVEFFVAFEAVLTVVILIAIGYALTFKGKITKEISSFISFLVVNISLPCLMASTISTSFSRAEIAGIPKAVLLPMVTILICYGAGYIIAKITKPKKERFGQVIVQTAQNNTIFMGLPVNIAMLGEVSVPYVLYYYMANTILFWTLGVYLISGKKSEKGALKHILSVIFSPPIYGLMAGLICLFFNIAIPKFAMDTIKYIGALTTPLSMFFIGYALCSAGLKNIKIDKDIIVGLISRLGVGPAISIAIFSLFNLPQLMMNVFTIQSFMPVMANAAIVAESHDSDTEYAAVMISISTIISLFLLPLVKVLFIH